MNLWDLITGNRGMDVDELARRLDMTATELQAAQPAYKTFTIPKRGGGERTIHAPAPELKHLQRRILRRLLGRLRAHPNATGFERGHSIASNAAYHAGRAVVICMDVAHFFPTTKAKRVKKYFRKIGWNREAARLLTNLCTHEGGLPQGAPTSPRLSNLVNYGLDARLAAIAVRNGAAYTRYADDMTFSFAKDDHKTIQAVIRATKFALADIGYRLHHRKKLHIRRRHQCQRVTGLVVNEQVALPRRTRRWLRAVEHHVATDRAATLTEEQLNGWRGMTSMVEAQRNASGPTA